jgi:hypothetical protein
VRILKFNDFAQLADDKALAPGTVPPMTTEDPKALIHPGPVPVKPVQPAAKPKPTTTTTAPKPAPKATAPKAAAPKPAPATAAPKPKPDEAPAPAKVPY